MVATGLLLVGAFLLAAGYLGLRRASTVAGLVVSVDPFEGDHPGGDDPVEWATAVTRWVAGGVLLLGIGVLGVAVLA